MPGNQNEWITTAEYAAKARVTIAAVRQWAYRGIGPKPRKPSGARLVLYRSDEVDAWLNGEPVGAGAAR